MNKLLILLIFIGTGLLLFGCGEAELIPEYISKESYYGEGYQDYTDYCKYFYDEDSIQKFETHNNFTLVTESNIENIKSYFENFNGWVEHQSYYDNYDFYYQSQIKEGDYYYIVSKEGEKSGDSLYGKYDNYEVYYVDLSKCILYYIHSNN